MQQPPVSNLTYLKLNIWRLDVALTYCFALKLPRESNDHSRQLENLNCMCPHGNLDNIPSTNNRSEFRLGQDPSTCSSYIRWMSNEITILRNGQDALSLPARRVIIIIEFFQRNLGAETK